MIFIHQARRLLKHRPGRLPLALGIVLALTWLMTVSAARPAFQPQTGFPGAIWLQEDTDTPSPTVTASPSLSPGPSETPTPATATVTATVSSTASPAVSLTVTQTSTAAASATPPPPSAPSPTWTPPYPTPIPPTEAIPAVLPSPTEAGPTATLMPLPTVTYQFPGVTPRGDLLSLGQPTAAQVLPKGSSQPSLKLNFSGGWLILLIIALWGGLVGWFVVTQIIAHRR